jgi:hypothetical protein
MGHYQVCLGFVPCRHALKNRLLVEDAEKEKSIDGPSLLGKTDEETCSVLDRETDAILMRCK